jgi:hypothetical protein
MKIPIYSSDLIQTLDQSYPARPPDPRHDEREIWMRAGERRLVERLLTLFKYSSEENLLDVHVISEDAAAAAASPASRTS